MAEKRRVRARVAVASSAAWAGVACGRAGSAPPEGGSIAGPSDAPRIDKSENGVAGWMV